VGLEKISLARSAGGRWSVALAAPGMRLDPGGLGKGFAIDRCVKRLVERGVRSALVDFSSTAYALGSPPGREGWSVAVRDPAGTRTILGCVRLRDAALAASGSAEKFFEAGGTRYGHILSPSTLRPVAEPCGAVVVAPSATRADGYATACCVLGARAIAFLARSPGIEGLVVVGGQGGAPLSLQTRGWSGFLERGA
jgi:thiamine biosynthesis lipoprotein